MTLNVCCHLLLSLLLPSLQQLNIYSQNINQIISALLKTLEQMSVAPGVKSNAIWGSARLYMVSPITSHPHLPPLSLCLAPSFQLSCLLAAPPNPETFSLKRLCAWVSSSLRSLMPPSYMKSPGLLWLVYCLATQTRM